MGWHNKRVLVTGGAGFIGCRVVIKLAHLGARVSVVDDLSKGEATNLSQVMDRIEFVKRDLLDIKAARECLRDKEFCFHFAAKIGGITYFHKYPATCLRDNMLMSLNLWDAARETQTKMICISSSMVFERTKVFPTPEAAVESSPPPLSGYGFSKLAAEYMCRTYHEESSVPYVIARPFNAYGPGENPGDYPGYAHVIPDLMDKILSGQYPLDILGNGTQVRSYTYVDDVADGVIFVAEYAENDDFNIGTGVETSVVELAEMIWSICGRQEPIKFRLLRSLKHDVQRRVPDVSKVRRLGWEAKVPLERGLESTLRWLKARRKS